MSPGKGPRCNQSDGRSELMDPFAIKFSSLGICINFDRSSSSRALGCLHSERSTISISLSRFSGSRLKRSWIQYCNQVTMGQATDGGKKWSFTAQLEVSHGADICKLRRRRNFDTTWFHLNGQKEIYTYSYMCSQPSPIHWALLVF